MKIQITFHEVEHHGDLNRCLDDLRTAGAIVVKHQLDTDEEVGYVLVEVTDKAKFLQLFSKTDSFPFSSLS